MEEALDLSFDRLLMRMMRSGGALLHGRVFGCVGSRSVPACPSFEAVLQAR